MKTEDGKLKEIFSKGLKPLEESAPDFDAMWESAMANTSRKKAQLRWKIAASVILLASVAVGIMLTRSTSERKMITTKQIGLWNAPTQCLMIGQAENQSTNLSQWTSPTDFLLLVNNKGINK